MNEYQKKLAMMTNDQMPKEELARINKLVADTKRFGELLVALPEAKDEFVKDPKGFLAKYKLDVDPKEMEFIYFDEHDQEKIKILKAPNCLDLMSESFFRYRQFIFNKLQVKDYLQQVGCAPKNERMNKWRERQKNRCEGDLGGVNGAFVHTVITYELATGCSVGCEFCGLGAKKLTKLFRATDENVKLFREVLKVCHEELGEAASKGVLYFATEPLDNPDYEIFEDAYYDEFKFIPQITTAVADRNIERTRALVNELKTKSGFIHRFTLRSLDMARKIFESFTPEELIQVEVIVQYPEAPGFMPYTVVGNASKDVDKKDIREGDPGTICCVDGFKVSFSDKTLTLFTPCHMSEKNPNGIAIVDTVSFEDAEDFRAKMLYLIDKYMVLELPSDEPLRLYNYFEKRDTDEGECLVSVNGGETLYLDKLNKPYIKEIVELLLEGKYSRREIAKIVYKDTGINPEMVFYYLNEFWKKGFIVDTVFFPEGE